jgi:FKBP-type peptidyl-prolyl cis-trans isomerase
MRAERKAQKRKESDNSKQESETVAKPLTREEKKALRKQQKKLEQKEERLRMIKEQREAKKIRKQKRMHREMNAPGGIEIAQEKKAKRQKAKTVSQATQKEEECIMSVYNSLFNGSHDDATGMTTLRMDVQYKDITVGKGPTVENLSLVTVSYKLKGGKFGAVIDSSKKFTFRVGKGEVIKGWDIGLIGMQVGGRRELIVPPKAGYGSQDIGAGPGAMLFFDITLLSIR